MEREHEKMSELLAKAMANVDADCFRSAMTEVLKDFLSKSHDCRCIVENAVLPTVKSIAREIAADPEVQKMLADRVRQQMFALAGRLELRDPGR